MVSNNNDFVGKGAVDDTDDIPKWCGNVFLLIDKIENEIIWRWADVVLDAFVLQAKVLFPPFVEILWPWSNAI